MPDTFDLLIWVGNEALFLWDRKRGGIGPPHLPGLSGAHPRSAPALPSLGGQQDPDGRPPAACGRGPPLPAAGAAGGPRRRLLGGAPGAGGLCSHGLHRAPRGKGPGAPPSGGAPGSRGLSRPQLVLPVCDRLPRAGGTGGAAAAHGPSPGRSPGGTPDLPGSLSCVLPRPGASAAGAAALRLAVSGGPWGAGPGPVKKFFEKFRTDVCIFLSSMV